MGRGNDWKFWAAKGERRNGEKKWKSGHGLSFYLQRRERNFATKSKNEKNFQFPLKRHSIDRKCRFRAF